MISPLSAALAVIAAVLPVTAGMSIDVNSTDSLLNATSTLAYGLMSYYVNNATDTPVDDIGTLSLPLYWWEAGAVWGGLIDYWAYTGDTSYIPTVTQALLAQVGPDWNYMPPSKNGQLGNDDQAFWAIACLTANEYGFPVPEGHSPTLWFDLAQAVFDTQAARWGTDICNGGLRWQIFEANAGWDYKNSISNGGFFQLAARLLHYTGNETYADWATRTWDWMYGVGLIDNSYNVFDGTDPKINCSEVNHVAWSYNPSMLLYGTAMMYNYTNGSEVWRDRTTGLVTVSANTFFSPFPNSTNIMYEFACEPRNTCNNDQYSFKAYLARWMSKAAIVAPYIADAIWPLLARSATAAAATCSSGGADTPSVCGTRWYVGGYDGVSGVGQSLSALETVQSLLLLRGDLAEIKRYPRTQANVVVEVVQPTGTFTISPTGTRMPGTGRGPEPGEYRPQNSAGSPSPDANAGNRIHSLMRCCSVFDSGVGAGAGTWSGLVLPVVVTGVAFGGWLVR